MNIFKKIIQAVDLLLINPNLFCKYLISNLRTLTSKWRYLKPNLNHSHKNINGVLFSIDFEYFGCNKDVKQMYFGCYQIALVEVMKRVLKAGGGFIDVGASIGYLTAIGASLVGEEGEVHSFEPIPQSFERLKRVAEMNPNYKIVVNRYALGEKSETRKIDFIKPPKSAVSTMVPSPLNISIPKETIEVSVIRLDEYIKEKKLDKISLIKIDVEGFEFPVLKGLKNYFESTNHRPVIICEIIPLAYSLFGCTRNHLIEYMKNFGYESYNIMNDKLKVDIRKFKEGTDVVFKASKYDKTSIQ